MFVYPHKVQYYETDQMRIVHHSNYIRWMEEARIELLARLGWDYRTMEDLGIVSPVTAVEGRYKRSARFGDTVSVEVRVTLYNGVRLQMHYDILDGEGHLLFNGKSENCFTDGEGNILNMKKAYPDFHTALAAQLEAPKELVRAGK